MAEELTFVFADLAGYTALTEAMATRTQLISRRTFTTSHGRRCRRVRDSSRRWLRRHARREQHFGASMNVAARVSAFASCAVRVEPSREGAGSEAHRSRVPHAGTTRRSSNTHRPRGQLLLLLFPRLRRHVCAGTRRTFRCNRNGHEVSRLHDRLLEEAASCSCDAKRRESARDHARHAWCTATGRRSTTHEEQP
jgi:hypothetical protein